MKIHLIAIGGSAMHNIALELSYRGHDVTGSDDEIYNPSRQRLDDAGLLPKEMGWFPDKLSDQIDGVILGMHARPDNPELERAKNLGLKIYSYPEFIFEQSKNKKRIVIAGSHGKTTTTSMILHVLNQLNIETDYLVGAQLEGFNRMVKLSDASIIVIEGDEYLSSPIDRRPKMLHYKPHIGVITGVAWDHINVFPSFANYASQFQLFADSFEDNGILFAFANDEVCQGIQMNFNQNGSQIQFYNGLESRANQQVSYKNELYPISVFGAHNRQNMEAALLVCQSLGISEKDFFKVIQNFTGASKRLEELECSSPAKVYLDFAHAPSKVKATVKAMRERFPNENLLCFLELHTFSSLNKSFLPEYKESLLPANEAIVHYNPHTLSMKKMPPLDKEYVKACFATSNVEIETDVVNIQRKLEEEKSNNQIILLMSSGNFGGIDLKNLFA